MRRASVYRLGFALTLYAVGCNSSEDDCYDDHGSSGSSDTEGSGSDSSSDTGSESSESDTGSDSGSSGDDESSGGSSTGAEATCTDGLHNGDETDVDCGGLECAPCADGLACVYDEQCASKVCDGETSTCAAPSCLDRTPNGNETAIDCGGDECSPCANQQQCLVATDCQSGVCVVDKESGAYCVAETCTDELRNGEEADVDCGGSDCLPCDAGATCLEGSDCASEICLDGGCQEPICGDGVVNQANEQCDTAGATDTCDDDCSLPSCGDGHVNLEHGETCDEGTNTALCDADCSAVECGDGWVNQSANESCDGAGQSATCDLDCTPASCGDGVVNLDADELCDDGGESEACDLDCTPSECGDGRVNATAGELCDTAGPSATCNEDCTPTQCGDAVVNAEAGETCDEGGWTEACDLDCTASQCGDGLVNPMADELCDTAGNTASCDGDCSVAFCGDGFANPEANETCDGGGESETCNADCTAVSCGDGKINATAGEECDDANTNTIDGCSDCKSTVSCVGGTPNGTVEGSEACDDGNLATGDGCSPTCELSLPAQCSATYGSLTAANRKVGVAKTMTLCDKDAGQANNDWAGAQWYRFEGSAGIKMPEAAPPTHSCNTNAPGWLNGTHPSMFEGVVARQVCFHWNGNTCAYTRNVQVVNCGDFYLYSLPAVAGCSLRYCGSN